MNNKIYVGKRASSFKAQGDTRKIEGIYLERDEDNAYIAGKEDGYVLELSCPYGSQEMADALFKAVGGKSYTAYTASNAVMDPEAELGDGVTINGIYSLFANRSMTIGSGHLGEISAPADSEIDHEFGVAEPFNRTVDRKFKGTRSYIEKKSDEIVMGVEKFENDTTQKLTEFKMDLDGFSLLVQDYEKGLSEFKQTVDGFKTTVEQYGDDVNEYGRQVSEWSQTVDGFKSTVEGYTGQVTKWQQDVNGFASQVEGYEGQITKWQQQVDGFSSTVEGYEGQVTEWKQQVEGFTSTVEGYEGQMSEWQQDMAGFESTVKGYGDTYSSWSQKVDSWSATVNGLDDTIQAAVQAEVKDGISSLRIKVSNGSLGHSDASITLTTESNASGNLNLGGVAGAFASDLNRGSSITLSAGTITLNGAAISISGNKFTLDSKYCEIDTEGHIIADQVAIGLRDGLSRPTDPWSGRVMLTTNGHIHLLPNTVDTAYPWSWALKGTPKGSMSSVWLLRAYSESGTNYAYLSASGQGAYVAGSPFKCVSSPTSGSDRDLKKDISELDGSYAAILDELNPALFRYNFEDDTMPLHYGYIAQDVESALKKLGIDRSRAAFLMGTDGKKDMGITYSEIIPLLHLKIKQLEQRILELEKSA